MHNHYIKTYKSSLIHFGHHCFARPQSWKSWSSGSRGLWDQSMNAMMTGMTKGTHMLSFDHDAHTHTHVYIYILESLSLYIYLYYITMNNSALVAVRFATICFAPPHSAIPHFQSRSIKII